MASEQQLERKGLRGRKTITIPAQFKPRFWEDSDRRCAVVRAIKRRYEAVKDQCGGNESIQRDMLCQRVVFIATILETQEVQAAEGGELDLGVYTQATNSLIGLLKTLGLEKRIKSFTDLRGYLDQKKGDAS
jgi:hypothetical protein